MFFALVLLLAATPALAQVSPSLYDYPRSGLDWYTIETEHFDILFHADEKGEGSTRTAQVVARIAEDVYGPITALYDHEPDSRVSIILKDYEDYSNGAAYFFDNKIDIWAPALDSPLRGDHNWLRNVITHEFTHIVQVQAAMKANRRVPIFYLQVLDYEDVRRPDVLYGYPNVLVTYPIPVVNNPAWFAEGTAQYQRAGLDYDRWDTHRDMLLRTRVLAGKELALAEMGGFYSKTSLMREGVYNHGFAFTQYLATTYGEDVLRRLSEALGEWRNWNFDRALEDVLDTPAEDVYSDWMTMLREEYETRTAEIRANEVDGDLLEAEGFSNYYPRFSPDGTRVAYVSNRGEDFSRTSLYVRNLDDGEVAAYDLGPTGGNLAYTCSFGHMLHLGGDRLRSGVGGAFTWRPDGEAIVYARRRDTPEGYLYADLYELDLDTQEETRLTVDQRATGPAFAPDGLRIAFVVQRDGTTNLYVLNRDTEVTEALTSWDDGTQVSDPVWHPSGEWIYFARLDPEGHGRDLWQIRPDGSGLEAVVATDADERTPAFGPDGTFLYYASDASGIFNLYRRPVDDTGAQSDRLTNVIGGAFMPDVRDDGALTFARYQWDGYKIAWVENPMPVQEEARLATYTPPPITQKQDVPAQATADYLALNDYQDAEVRPLESEAIAAVHTEGRFPLGTGAADTTATTARTGDLDVEPYGLEFTAFSFFPTLRLDQYVSRQRSRMDARIPDRTRGEALLRNTKIGTYVSSREILEGLSLLGGLLVGPASQDASSVSDFFSPSRLLDLERDAFLSVEYKRGLGFIPQRWSPQFAIELYNIRRRVDNGLSIEEFPCTACLPDTTLADLAYGLWEADLFVRSKINRSVLLEAGYRYSPYKVTTERFFSKEAAQFIPESSSRYFIGRAFMLNAYLQALRPTRDTDVLMEGLRGELRYEVENGRLLNRFEIEDGVLVPGYERERNHRITLEAQYGLRLPGQVRGGPHGIGVRLRASTILGDAVDAFYNDYVGGLTGARGYPFYALGGNETLWLQASYKLPLFPRIHRQAAFTYIDKVYARLYADAAMAWSGPWPGLDAVRPDVGAELRVGVGSFYLLPTALFLSGTYGLSTFDFQLDEGFVTPDGSDRVRYGGELQWHFGLLFGFDL
jgi:Tol biopolymer transport system component